MNPNQQPQRPTKDNRPAYYDANGQPVYQQAPISPARDTTPNAVPDPNTGDRPEVAPAAKAAQSKVVGPESAASHVTSAPESHTGQSFDPRMRSQYANEPGVVHATRDLEPEKREISEELEQRHQDSKRRYPHLNLSQGEVVILSIKRHPIGLLLPLVSGGVVLFALVAVLIMYPADAQQYNLPGYGVMVMIAVLIMLLVGIGTYVAVWVYQKNQFYMTNESVIQEIQHSLFSKREQTVSLGSIEDASFRQTGILQTMLNYGTIRLSTEGEETTYRFAYVENPRDQVAILNNGVESFKNGRPVELNGNDN